ncbi:hypothetical protein FOMPIDRAFT_63752, partial [Fomitopsis schrenkii]
MVPCHGTYLIVQLDAVRMVEPLQDPVLLAAARVLPSQKYVAHVLEIDELPMPFKRDHKCQLVLVGKGLCQEDEDCCIDSTMCIPISPATVHPLARKPLQPRPIFPFVDCYQCTFATPQVRIPNRPYDHRHAVSLAAHDAVLQDIYITEDAHRRRSL